MGDDVIINKAATVERCIQRIQEDYDSDFRTNFTKQDAVILNLERACQACIDIAAHVVKSRKFGIPQTTRDLFVLLAENQLISVELSKNLQGMVSFRNIAVHDYTSLNLDIIVSIVEKHLTDFTTILLKNNG
ncbi:MAG: DUF86 domain-containing protein [Tunicatimonas sp.]|uniref:type VII toxin-antitoxin system HepT family RNase toxin n=1 Tax=Tunicatimonas sp. TaxID=1940096 RepID=UPI003C771353